jgi:5-(carboxyamino)imidazole ribonucleotide mutase
MPAGVPVATVSIDGAKNAALLALRILATSEPALLEKLDEFRASLVETVLEKDAKLKSSL